MLAALTAACLLACPPALADERADTEREISATADQIDALAAQVEEAKDSCARLYDEIDAAAAEAEERQAETLRLSEQRDRALVALYKHGGTPGIVSAIFDSSSLPELVENSSYLEYVSNHAQSLVEKSRKSEEELAEHIKELDSKKNEQSEKVRDLVEKRDALSTEMSQLKDDLASFDAASRATTAILSSYAFDSGDTSDWRSGVASAYGGHSDASVAPGARTATGDPVTETTMGVAVPMAWDDYQSYFGKKVEISYGGKSVIATVNDCGSMGGGSRSLDLQPGVFRAFGANDCFEWGLREVRFRFL